MASFVKGKHCKKRVASFVYGPPVALSCIYETWAPCPDSTPVYSDDEGPAYPMGPPAWREYHPYLPDPAPALVPASWREHRRNRFRKSGYPTMHVWVPRNTLYLRARLSCLELERADDERRDANQQEETTQEERRPAMEEPRACWQPEEEPRASQRSPEDQLELKKSRTI